MIARLIGTLLELDGPRLLIAPGSPATDHDAAVGVVYEVLVPAYLVETLAARLGSTVTLETIHYLEQQGQGTSFIPRILGFGSIKEKEFFETFTGVKGLGMKRSLRALAMPPGMVARMIAEGDSRALTRLPEIGKKLADTIVLELKDSVDEFLDWHAHHSTTQSAETQGHVAGTHANGISTSNASIKKARSTKRVAPSMVEAKPTAAVGSNPTSVAQPTADPFLAARAASREAVETLIALGEQPLEAERLVGKVMESARRNGQQPPTQAEAILTLAYAARRG